MNDENKNEEDEAEVEATDSPMRRTRVKPGDAPSAEEHDSMFGRPHGARPESDKNGLRWSTAQTERLASDKELSAQLVEGLPLPPKR